MFLQGSIIPASALIRMINESNFKLVVYKGNSLWYTFHCLKVQIWFIGRTLASQAGKAGSIPVICFSPFIRRKPLIFQESRACGFLSAGSVFRRPLWVFAGRLCFLQAAFGLCPQALFSASHLRFLPAVLVFFFRQAPKPKRNLPQKPKSPPVSARRSGTSP